MAETHPVELQLTRSLPGCCVPHGILEAQFIRDLEPGLDGPKRPWWSAHGLLGRPYSFLVPSSPWDSTSRSLAISALCGLR